MKKLFQVYKSFMIRPTVYKAFPRLIGGLLVAGLWNRYANTMQIHQMTQSIFLSDWFHLFGNGMV